MESVFRPRKEESVDTRRPLRVNNSTEVLDCSDDWLIVQMVDCFITYYEKNFKLDTRRTKFLPRYNDISIASNELVDAVGHGKQYWTPIETVS